jgi:hypothetical protein
MIRPLRQRHRIMISTLSVIIPTTFALGIATRKVIPLSPSSANAPAKIGNYTEIWNRNDLWDKSVLRTRLLKSTSNLLLVELTSVKQIVRPDLLVYWVPGETRVQDSLPDNAFLLGSFDQAAPVSFALPNQATTKSGSLILYTLADHEIIDVSKSVTF